MYNTHLLLVVVFHCHYSIVCEFCYFKMPKIKSTGVAHPGKERKETQSPNLLAPIHAYETLAVEPLLK